MINNIKMDIWSRSFDLEVIYDCYEGEQISERQISAVEEFVAMPEKINGILNLLKDYCVQTNSEEFPTKSIDNIFKYVKPKTIYVKRPRKDSPIKLAVLCAYRYDQENGIAIVFADNEFLSIGTQNIIL